MDLKLFQYGAPRYQSYQDLDAYREDHPKVLEPEFHCEQGAENVGNCVSCIGLRMARAWCDKTFQAQHAVVDNERTAGMSIILGV